MDEKSIIVGFLRPNNLGSSNLSPLANAALTPHQDWLLYPDASHDASPLPVGEQRLGGILFHLAQKQGVPKAIALCGRTSRRLPSTARIPLHARISQIFFLHACGWFVPRGGTEVASYEFHYADGAAERLLESTSLT